jgi:S1-C subfamily serine protease
MEQEKDNTLQQIAENALKNSVVRLNVERKTPCLASRPQFDFIKIETSNGSGFFIDKHLIVTNFHVIVGVTSVTIKLSGQEESYQIESIETYDAENDLIILKVNCEGVPLTLGDSATIQDEDEICAVGYPNDQAEIEHGTIVNIWKRPSGDLICLTTKSTGGSSGSPILNSKGEIIGMKSSSRIDEAENVVCGYAIPSNRLKKFVQDRAESVPFDKWQELPEVRYLAEIDAAEKFRKDGDLKEAIVYYDMAIDLVPDKQEAYIGRADAKLELGFLKEATTDQITLLRSYSVPFSFSNIRESILLRWNMLKLYCLRFSLHLFVSIIGRRFWLTANASSYIRKAKSARDKGNNRDVREYYKYAISLYSEVIDLKEKTGITYNSRGWARYLLGQFENRQVNIEEAGYCYHYAIDDIDAAFKFNPKLSRVRAAFYHTRGAAKAGLGDHSRAIEDFNESIRLRPKKALYYQDRGLSKEALGQQEAAEADFAKAKELDSD